MHRLILLCFLVSVVITSPTFAASDCCAVGAEQGFVSLFNGKDLSGWNVMGSKSWKSVNGILTCEGNGGGWLRSDKKYTDFVLRLDYKVSKGGNSGVFLRATEAGNPAYTGMEIQIEDDHGRPLHPGSSNALYGAVSPSVEAIKPAGQWNSLEISCIGERLQVRANGQQVLNVDLGDSKLNAKLGSQRLDKRAKTGYIGLQNHGSKVEFRNVRIKKL